MFDIFKKTLGLTLLVIACGIGIVVGFIPGENLIPFPLRILIGISAVVILLLFMLSGYSGSNRGGMNLLGRFALFSALKQLLESGQELGVVPEEVTYALQQLVAVSEEAHNWNELRMQLVPEAKTLRDAIAEWYSHSALPFAGLIFSLSNNFWVSIVYSPSPEFLETLSDDEADVLSAALSWLSAFKKLASHV